MKFSYFLPSSFPSVSQLLPSKAKLSGPKRQKHQLGLIELFFYVQSAGKEQMENEKAKLHLKWLPETITSSSTHLSPVGKERVWTDDTEQEMLSSQTLPQWSSAKTAEVGHSHRHKGTVSTSRHSWVKRSSVEGLGESLQAHSQIITWASGERAWDCTAQHIWISPVTALFCYQWVESCLSTAFAQ